MPDVVKFMLIVALRFVNGQSPRGGVRCRDATTYCISDAVDALDLQAFYARYEEVARASSRAGS